MQRARLEALILLAFAGGYIWGGLSLPPHYSYQGVPGPSVFPTLLGITMGLLAAWLLVFPEESSPEESSRVETTLTRAALRERLWASWRFYLMWSLLISYAFLMPNVGFWLSSTLLLILFILLLGEKRWYVAIFVAVFFTTALYFLFVKVLQVSLPAGIVEHLLLLRR